MLYPSLRFFYFGKSETKKQQIRLDNCTVSWIYQSSLKKILKNFEVRIK